MSIGFFFGFSDAILFQPLIKVEYFSISWFFICYCLKMALKINHHSKFIMALEIFANWPVQFMKNLSNPRISKPLSNKI